MITKLTNVVHVHACEVKVCFCCFICTDIVFRETRLYRIFLMFWVFFFNLETPRQWSACSLPCTCEKRS